jgi:fructose-specific phosphotransferase system IIC component
VDDHVDEDVGTHVLHVQLLVLVPKHLNALLELILLPVVSVLFIKLVIGHCRQQSLELHQINEHLLQQLGLLDGGLGFAHRHLALGVIKGLESVVLELLG